MVTFPSNELIVNFPCTIYSGSIPMNTKNKNSYKKVSVTEYLDVLAWTPCCCGSITYLSQPDFFNFKN